MENNLQQAVLAAVRLEATGLGRVFDPTVHDLDPSFRLTRFADLKG